MSLKILSLNMEGDARIPRVKEFIADQAPDVVCLQEMPLCLVEELKYFSGGFRYGLYRRVNSHGKRPPIGIGLFSRMPFYNIRVSGYTGHEQPRETRKSAIDEMCIFGSIYDTTKVYRIGTTHVRVTKHGQSTPAQMRSMNDLASLLQEEAKLHKGLLMTGDFNAPRGRKAFSRIAEVLTDGVPPHYHTSLDPVLHKVGHKNWSRMVDGLFHTPNYVLENTRMHMGVSDHQALTCILSVR